VLIRPRVTAALRLMECPARLRCLLKRGIEEMDNSYAVMDLTVYGRQEPWEDSSPGWPQQCSYTRTNAGSPV
jgi:hypothetical protein